MTAVVRQHTDRTLTFAIAQIIKESPSPLSLEQIAGKLAQAHLAAPADQVKHVVENLTGHQIGARVQQHSDGERKNAHARADAVRAVRESIFAEVIAERMRQIDLGLDDDHDRTLPPERWLLIMHRELDDLVRQGGEIDLDRWRRQVIRALVVGFASLEVMDLPSVAVASPPAKIIAPVPSSGP